MPEQNTVAAPSRHFDVEELDQLCEASLSTNEPDRRNAETLLLQFESSLGAWTRVPEVLAATNRPATRFFALRVLDTHVRLAWGTLDAEERLYVRKFVVDTINDGAGSDSPLRSDRPYLLKLNAVLLRIVTLDWPQDWPDFLESFLDTAQISSSHCENCLSFLQMLADEVNGEAGRLSTLKNAEALTNFRLLEAVLRPVEQLQPGDDLLLLPAAVATLAALLEAVESTMIFETELVNQLLQCLRFPELQMAAMRGLAELISLCEEDGTKEMLRSSAFSALQAIDLAATIEAAPENEEQRRLTVFAHELLGEIALEEEAAVLKVCFEYWCHLLHTADGALETLDCLRLVLLRRMLPPTEIHYLEEDGDGELLRLDLTDTETLAARTSPFFAAALAESNPSLPLSCGSSLRVEVCACWLRSGSVTTFSTLSPEKQEAKLAYLARANGVFASDRGYLQEAVAICLVVLEDSQNYPAPIVEAACDAFYRISTNCAPAFGEGVPSIAEGILRTRLDRIWGSLEDSLQKVFSGIGAVLRHVKSPDKREQLLSLLVSDLNLTLVHGVSGLTQHPSSAADGPVLLAAIYRVVRLNASLALSLRSSYSSQLHHIFPSLLQLYRQASSYIHETVEQEGPEAAEKSAVRLARMIRKQLHLLMTCYTLSLSHDAPTFGNGSPLSLPAAHESASARSLLALTHFADVLLPAWLEVIMLDFSSSPIELAEVALLDFCHQVLACLGPALDPAVLNAMLLPGVAWMLSHVRQDRFRDFPELRCAAYFVFGFAISHQALRLEQHLPEAQDELAELCMYGMGVQNRDVAKNALVAAYHLHASCAPERISAMSRSQASSAFSFFERHALVFLCRTWELMNDGLHGTVFENQAPLIARIWEVTASYPQRIFSSEAYQLNETNEGLMRRWMVEMLLQTFPALTSDVETCYAIFEDLWSMPRRNVEEEDVFGRRLKDYILDLQHFRTAARA
ncbi:hypothetical protein JCM10213v2_000976 [Rhodosporidiobolus nylandii]